MRSGRFFSHASTPFLTVRAKETWSFALGELFARRSKWMAVYTWSHTTWGGHSTQRAEAVHCALASRKLKNLSAVSLIDEMDAYKLTTSCLAHEEK